jgi:hypothetical protein
MGALHYGFSFRVARSSRTIGTSGDAHASAKQQPERLRERTSSGVAAALRRMRESQHAVRWEGEEEDGGGGWRRWIGGNGIGTSRHSCGGRHPLAGVPILQGGRREIPARPNPCVGKVRGLGPHA